MNINLITNTSKKHYHTYTHLMTRYLQVAGSEWYQVMDRTNRPDHSWAITEFNYQDRKFKNPTDCFKCISGNTIHYIYKKLDKPITSEYIPLL